MKPALAGRNHIERHHAGQHDPPRQSLAQHADIADAVLQADDDGIMRRMLCDDVGDPGGIGALDRDKHHAGIAKNRRIFRQRQLVRRNPAVEALEARQPQPVAFDLGDHARPRQQRDLTAARRNMPPTKQPMLPAPAMPIVRSTVIAPAFVQLRFDSRFLSAVPSPSPRAAPARAL